MIPQLCRLNSGDGRLTWLWCSLRSASYRKDSDDLGDSPSSYCHSVSTVSFPKPLCKFKPCLSFLWTMFMPISMVSVSFDCDSQGSFSLFPCQQCHCDITHVSHPLKAGSVESRIFTVLCVHHHNLILETFLIIPKRNPVTICGHFLLLL